MQSGDNSLLTDASTPTSLLELAIAFYVLRPVFESDTQIIQQCSRIGFLVDGFEFERSTDVWSIGSSVSGHRLSVSETQVLLQQDLVPEDVRRTVAGRISGSVLGASYGSAVVARLFQLRPQVLLTATEFIRLLGVVWPALLRTGSWATWQVNLESLLLEREDLTVADHLLLLRWTAVTARWLGQLAHSENLLHEAMGLADQYERKNAYGLCLLELAILQRYHGHFDSAHAMLKKAAHLLAISGTKHNQDRCVLEACNLSNALGEASQTLNLLDTVPETVAALVLRAEALLLLDDHIHAHECAARAVDNALVHLPEQGRAYATLGRILLIMEQYEDAQSALEHAIHLMNTACDRIGLWRVQALLAQLYACAGDYHFACELLEAAYSEQLTIDDRIGQRGTLQVLGMVCTDGAEFWLSQNDIREASDFVVRMQKYIDMA